MHIEDRGCLFDNVTFGFFSLAHYLILSLLTLIIPTGIFCQGFFSFFIQIFKTVKDGFLGGRSKDYVSREGSAQG